MIKQVLRPDRLRQVPEQFSWVDQGLVRRHLIDRCGAQGSALYLFLVTVADSQGLSYYGDGTLAAHLHLGAEELGRVRAHLCQLDLIAYKAPIYQVLSLPPTVPPSARPARVRQPSDGQPSASEHLAELRAILKYNRA
jgi:ABC-type cobalamin transport system ATPase subunit